MSPATPPVTVTDYAAAAEARSFTGLEKGSVHTSDMWKSFTRNPAGAAWYGAIIRHARSEGRGEPGRLGRMNPFFFVCVRVETLVSDGGRRSQRHCTSQEPLHMWRQLCQMVFSGNSP